jgi:hypothetical protein
LFNEGVSLLYAHDKDIMQTTNYHFGQIMQRGQKALAEAKELLEQVRRGRVGVELLSEFAFPPIDGPGLDEMTERATRLVEAYEELYAERPRNLPLTEEENRRLMMEAVKDWEW